MPKMPTPGKRYKTTVPVADVDNTSTLQTAINNAPNDSTLSISGYCATSLTVTSKSNLTLNVNLQGGRHIYDWSLVSPLDAMYSRIPAASRANVWVCRLSRWGIASITSPGNTLWSNTPRIEVDNSGWTEIIVNGQVLLPCRYPDPFNGDSWLLNNGATATTITANNGDPPTVASWAGAYIEGFIVSARYQYGKSAISSVVTNTVTFAQISTAGAASTGWRYCFNNLPEFLTKQGTCYIDTTNLVAYIIPPTGVTDPNDVETLITEGGSTALKLVGCTNCTVQGSIRAQLGSGVSVDANSTGCTINNCSFQGIWGYGAYLQGTNNFVVGCSFTDVGDTNVSLWGSTSATPWIAFTPDSLACYNSTFNRLHRHFIAKKPAVSMYGRNISLINFTISGVYGSAIEMANPPQSVPFPRSNNILVKNGTITATKFLPWDSAPIYGIARNFTQRGFTIDTVTFNNITDFRSVGNRSDGSNVYCIYFDEMLSDGVVKNCKAINCDAYFAIFQGGSGCKLLNNDLSGSTLTNGLLLVPICWDSSVNFAVPKQPTLRSSGLARSVTNRTAVTQNSGNATITIDALPAASYGQIATKAQIDTNFIIEWGTNGSKGWSNILNTCPTDGTSVQIDTANLTSNLVNGDVGKVVGKYRLDGSEFDVLGLPGNANWTSRYPSLDNLFLLAQDEYRKMYSTVISGNNWGALASNNQVIQNGDAAAWQGTNLQAGGALTTISVS